MAAAKGWASARLDEIPSVTDSGLPEWKPLRHHFGVRAFGVNAWFAREAGEQLIDDHDELQSDGSPGHEELYAITSGRATFTIGGERLDAPAGTIVFISDPALKRVAFAEDPNTTAIAIGGWPDRAFEPSAWEQRRVE